MTGWVNERAARCTRLADARAAGGRAGEGASAATAKRIRGEILGVIYSFDSLRWQLDQPKSKVWPVCFFSIFFLWQIAFPQKIRRDTPAPRLGFLISGPRGFG